MYAFPMVLANERGHYGSPHKNPRGNFYLGMLFVGATGWLLARQALRAPRKGASHARIAQGSSSKLTPADVAPQLAAVDAQKNKGMAASLHPRVSVKPDIDVAEVDKWLKKQLGPEVTLAEISHAYAPPSGFTAVIRKVRANPHEVFITMNLQDSDGNIIGSLKRNFVNGEAFHASIEVDKQYQGTGFATAINGQSLLRYEKMGVKKIGLQAHWIGKVAWASTGFNFSDEEKAFNEANQYLTSKFEGPELEEKREVAKALIREPWNLAKWDDGRLYEVSFENTTAGINTKEQVSAQLPLGRAILLQMSNWLGEMAIDRSNPGYLNALKKLEVEKKK